MKNNKLDSASLASRKQPKQAASRRASSESVASSNPKKRPTSAASAKVRMSRLPSPSPSDLGPVAPVPQSPPAEDGLASVLITDSRISNIDALDSTVASLNATRQYLLTDMEEGREAYADREYVFTTHYRTKRTGELLPFTCSLEAVKDFHDKLFAGARVAITKGPYEGTEATIIGVREEALWRHDDTEVGATPFNACRGRDNFAEQYGLQVTGYCELPQVQKIAVKESEADRERGSPRSKTKKATKKGDKKKKTSLSRTQSGSGVLAALLDGSEDDDAEETNPQLIALEKRMTLMTSDPSIVFSRLPRTTQLMYTRVRRPFFYPAPLPLPMPTAHLASQVANETTIGNVSIRPPSPTANPHAFASSAASLATSNIPRPLGSFPIEIAMYDISHVSFDEYGAKAIPTIAEAGKGKASSGTGKKSAPQPPPTTVTKQQEVMRRAAMMQLRLGQRMLYTSGPYTGKTCIIIGLQGGKLVRQNEGEDGYPLAFDARDPIAEAGLICLSTSVDVVEAPSCPLLIEQVMSGQRALLDSSRGGGNNTSTSTPAATNLTLNFRGFAPTASRPSPVGTVNNVTVASAAEALLKAGRTTLSHMTVTADAEDSYYLPGTSFLNRYCRLVQERNTGSPRSPTGGHTTRFTLPPSGQPAGSQSSPSSTAAAPEAVAASNALPILPAPIDEPSTWRPIRSLYGDVIHACGYHYSAAPPLMAPLNIVPKLRVRFVSVNPIGGPLPPSHASAGLVDSDMIGTTAVVLGFRSPADGVDFDVPEWAKYLAATRASVYPLTRAEIYEKHFPNLLRPHGLLDKFQEEIEQRRLVEEAAKKEQSAQTLQAPPPPATPELLHLEVASDNQNASVAEFRLSPEERVSEFFTSHTPLLYVYSEAHHCVRSVPLAVFYGDHDADIAPHRAVPIGYMAGPIIVPSKLSDRHEGSAGCYRKSLLKRMQPPIPDHIQTILENLLGRAKDMELLDQIMEDDMFEGGAEGDEDDASETSESSMGGASVSTDGIGSPLSSPRLNAKDISTPVRAPASPRGMSHDDTIDLDASNEKGLSSSAVIAVTADAEKTVRKIKKDIQKQRKKKERYDFRSEARMVRSIGGGDTVSASGTASRAFGAGGGYGGFSLIPKPTPTLPDMILFMCDVQSIANRFVQIGGILRHHHNHNLLNSEDSLAALQPPNIIPKKAFSVDVRRYERTAQLFAQHEMKMVLAVRQDGRRLLRNNLGSNPDSVGSLEWVVRTLPDDFSAEFLGLSLTTSSQPISPEISVSAKDKASPLSISRMTKNTDLLQLQGRTTTDVPQLMSVDLRAGAMSYRHSEQLVAMSDPYWGSQEAFGSLDTILTSVGGSASLAPIQHLPRAANGSTITAFTDCLGNQLFPGAVVMLTVGVRYGKRGVVIGCGREVIRQGPKDEALDKLPTVAARFFTPPKAADGWTYRCVVCFDDEGGMIETLNLNCEPFVMLENNFVQGNEMAELLRRVEDSQVDLKAMYFASNGNSKDGPAPGLSGRGSLFFSANRQASGTFGNGGFRGGGGSLGALAAASAVGSNVALLSARSATGSGGSNSAPPTGRKNSGVSPRQAMEASGSGPDALSTSQTERDKTANAHSDQDDGGGKVLWTSERDGQLVAFDTTPEATGIYGLYALQRIEVVGRHYTQHKQVVADRQAASLALAAGGLSILTAFNRRRQQNPGTAYPNYQQALAKMTNYPISTSNLSLISGHPLARRGTVLGVYDRELWVLMDDTHKAAPLLGSAIAGLHANYRLDVIGLAADFPVGGTGATIGNDVALATAATLLDPLIGGDALSFNMNGLKGQSASASVAANGGATSTAVASNATQHIVDKLYLASRPRAFMTVTSTSAEAQASQHDLDEDLLLPPPLPSSDIHSSAGFLKPYLVSWPIRHASPKAHALDDRSLHDSTLWWSGQPRLAWDVLKRAATKVHKTSATHVTLTILLDTREEAVRYLTMGKFGVGDVIASASRLAKPVYRDGGWHHYGPSVQCTAVGVAYGMLFGIFDEVIALERAKQASVDMEDRKVSLFTVAPIAPLTQYDVIGHSLIDNSSNTTKERLTRPKNLSKDPTLPFLAQSELLGLLPSEYLRMPIFGCTSEYHAKMIAESNHAKREAQREALLEQQQEEEALEKDGSIRPAASLSALNEAPNSTAPTPIAPPQPQTSSSSKVSTLWRTLTEARYGPLSSYQGTTSYQKDIEGTCGAAGASNEGLSTKDAPLHAALTSAAAFGQMYPETYLPFGGKTYLLSDERLVEDCFSQWVDAGKPTSAGRYGDFIDAFCDAHQHTVLVMPSGLDVQFVRGLFSQYVANANASDVISELVSWVLASCGLRALLPGQTALDGFVKLLIAADVATPPRQASKYTAHINSAASALPPLPTWADWQVHQTITLVAAEIRQRRDIFDTSVKDWSTLILEEKHHLKQILSRLFDNGNEMMAGSGMARKGTNVSLRMMAVMAPSESAARNVESVLRTMSAVSRDSAASAREAFGLSTELSMPVDDASAATAPDPRRKKRSKGGNAFSGPMSMRPRSSLLPWEFPYILAKGRHVVFDISYQACLPFGAFHGQRFKVTRGDYHGSVAVIIGVLMGKLWRYREDGNCEAQPFSGTCACDIFVVHGLELLDPIPPVGSSGTVISDLRSDVDPVSGIQSELSVYNAAASGLTSSGKADTSAKVPSWTTTRSLRESRPSPFVRTADPFLYHTLHGEIVDFDVTPSTFADLVAGRVSGTTKNMAHNHSAATDDEAIPLRFGDRYAIGNPLYLQSLCNIRRDPTNSTLSAKKGKAPPRSFKHSSVGNQSPRKSNQSPMNSPKRTGRTAGATTTTLQPMDGKSSEATAYYEHLTSDEGAATDPTAPQYGTITIVGCREGRVWFAIDECGAQPFMSGAVEGFMHELQLTYLYTADIESNALDFQADQKVSVFHTQKGGQIVINTSPDAIAVFGPFTHGQIVTVSNVLVGLAGGGNANGLSTTIIGVRCGKLYHQLAESSYCVPFEVCASALMRSFKVTSRNERNTAVNGGDAMRMISPVGRFREQRFTFPSPSGDLYCFDVSDASCRGLFGFSHGDRVKITKPEQQAGKCVVILGARGKQLWYVDEQSGVSAVFHGLRDHHALMASHGLMWVGRTSIKESIG